VTEVFFPEALEFFSSPTEPQNNMLHFKIRLTSELMSVKNELV